MRSLSFSLLLALASLAVAVPYRDCPHRLKESVPPPRGWVKAAPAHPDLVIDLRIALPQPNFHELERHLYEVSDPEHSRYGEHLSKEEVEELVAPHPESLEAVDSWLATHGLTNDALTRTPANDWVKISIPVKLAEKMFDTEYHVWLHEATGVTAVRTTSYSLPELLHEHIDVVHPTTYFPSTRNHASHSHFSPPLPPTSANRLLLGDSLDVPYAFNGKVDTDCRNNITISCLQQLYNIGDYKPNPRNSKKNSIALTGYLEQFANIEDLQSFYAMQRPEAVGSSFKTISVNGGLNNQTLSEAGAEGNLDTQFGLGLTYPIPGIYYTTAGRPPINLDNHTPSNTNEPYQDWVDYVLSHGNPPQTISTSYGDDEQTVPRAYATRVCRGLAQLGARGVSVIFSSGDFGVGDGSSDPNDHVCQTNDGRNATRFIPVFPATCPYVTSVGGTVNIPETGVFFSGGGFSDYFDAPSYQKAQTKKYVKALPKGTYKGLYNPQGRGFPDISAQSNRFVIYYQGRLAHIGGTSASAPTIGGIVALLNDARISQGKSPLGFLNPFLYGNAVSKSVALNDITTGNNPGCGTTGFNATAGWDPITGLGTPNFGKLKDLVLNRY